MIDKLDVEIPKNAGYTRVFSNLMQLAETPEWHRKVWRDGGHYMRRGDLREISNGDFPVILHQMNRHQKNSGDKVELIETGTMNLGDMQSIMAEMYRAVDAQDNRIMRLDLAADHEGVEVQWFRDNTEVLAKQTHREWLACNISSKRAETLTAGNKPNQLRVYNKTAHRQLLLDAENRKIKRKFTEDGQHQAECALTFQERWGYPSERIVTRVERQIGGANVKRFGYAKVGHLWEIDKADPFEQIVFPSDLNVFPRSRKGVDSLKPEQQLAAMYLRSLVLKDGVMLAKNELFRTCTSRDQFYRLWKRYKEFALPEGEGEVTRKGLLESFRASINRQLQRAA